MSYEKKNFHPRSSGGDQQELDYGTMELKLYNNKGH